MTLPEAIRRAKRCSCVKCVVWVKYLEGFAKKTLY